MPTESSLDANDGSADVLLGQRVRSLRVKSGLSLTQLSQATGLSTGMLSQLERGLSTPSLRTLRLLSNSFRVPVSEFFGDEIPSEDGGFIVRKSRRRVLNLSATGIVKELMSPDRCKNVVICNLKVSPGGKSDTEWMKNSGQKAGFIVNGEIRLFINNNKFILKEGDAFCFDGSYDHRFDNVSKNEAEIIWIFIESNIIEDFVRI